MDDKNRRNVHNVNGGQVKSPSGAGGQMPPRAQTGRPKARRDLPTPQNNKNTSLAKKDENSLVGLIKDGAKMIRRAEIKKDREWEAAPVQRLLHPLDRPMLMITMIIVVLGTIMVFSASYPSALAEGESSMFYIKKQLLWLFIGTIAMFAASALPYQVYRDLGPWYAAGSLVLMILVFFIGEEHNGAKRWIDIGITEIQPSEFAKAGLILLLAYFIDKYEEDIRNKSLKKRAFVFEIVLPGVIIAGFCLLVLLQKHLSGAVIMGMIGVAIVFVSGAAVWKILACYCLPAGAAFLIYISIFDYAKARIDTHNNENADVLGEAWQSTQGLNAIGNGGFLGMGLGDSNLKHNYVSEAHNDFIFTIWCEELGFVGAVILIALYGFLIWRGIVIARKAPDTFSSLTAFGITFQIGFQTMLNIMVVTGIIFNTGVSLPFFSYGGSSLILLMAEVGILLSISRHSYQMK